MHNSVLFTVRRRGEVERFKAEAEAEAEAEFGRSRAGPRTWILQPLFVAARQICSASTLTDDTHMLLTAMLLPVVVRVYAFA
jgi:hypothetical protein